MRNAILRNPVIREGLSKFTRSMAAGLPVLVFFGIWAIRSGFGQLPGAAGGYAIPAAAHLPSANSCTSCHTLDPMLSHPVEIAPTMSVPASLPLNDGKVTCVTCHDDNPTAHIRAKEKHDGMLRISASAALCAQCHGDTDLGQMKGREMHSMLGRAHLQFASREKGWGKLDAESSTCLACHDGTVAKGVGIGIDGQPGDAGDHARSHPIGTIYKDKHTFPMVPRSAVNRRIRLFDEKLGCGSCHSPYSKEAGLLVMSNLRSKLCLSCHQEN